MEDYVGILDFKIAIISRILTGILLIDFQGKLVAGLVSWAGGARELRLFI